MEKGKENLDTLLLKRSMVLINEEMIELKKQNPFRLSVCVVVVRGNTRCHYKLKAFVNIKVTFSERQKF